GYGPIEGRPPGADWAHQRYYEFLPQVAYDFSVGGCGTNPIGNIPPSFSPTLPVQNPNSLWCYLGTLPPKLLKARYGEPILFRLHNRLPADVRLNGGFGRNTLTTHLHNGHQGAESDGFTGAFFFPGQFYDYHWPICLAGFSTINTNATDPRAG